MIYAYGYGFIEEPKSKLPNPKLFIPVVTIAAIIMALFFCGCAYAEVLKASWYSIESLKKEGTWKTSKGVMANGHKFSNARSTCATRLYPLGTILRILNLQNGRVVVVKVTDRIGKRFATKRVDLSKAAFREIAYLWRGTVPIKVAKLK